MREPEDKASPLSGATGLLTVFSLASSILIVFIVFPLIMIFGVAGTSGIREALSSSEAVHSIMLSLYASALAATIAAVFGVPLAYLLSRARLRGSELLEAVLDLPLVVPHTVAGIAVLLAFNSRSAVGSILAGAGFRVEDSFWGIVLAMLFVSTPFMVNLAREGFESIDVSLEHVARSLGAGPWKVFLTISVPLAWRGILVGWLTAMARALSEVGAIMIVAYRPMVASILVWEWFTTRGLAAAAGLSSLLLLASLAVLVAMRVVEGRGR